MSLECAKKLKERYSYVCPDLAKEFNKYDTQPEKWFKVHEFINDVTKKPFKVEVGYERFLAPEMFFNPEIFSSDFLTPLPDALLKVDTRDIPENVKSVFWLTLVGG